MKLLLTLLLSCFNTIFVIAQNEIEQKLCSEWQYEGYSFEGSFYPVNYWHETLLIFHEDYRFESSVKNTLSSQANATFNHGKWNLSNDTSTLSLYADEERFVANQRVMVYEKSFQIHFFYENFLEVYVNEDDILKLKRYKKKNAEQTFEENYTSFLIQKTQPKVSYSSENFSLLYGKNLEKNKLQQFNKSTYEVNVISYYPYPSLQKRTQHFTAKIIDFDEQMISFSVEKKYTKEAFTNSSIQKTYNSYKEPEILKLNKDQITGILTPTKRIAYQTTAIASTASFITTFILAPIISYQLTTKSFNKDRYFAIAGTGLAGMAVFIPATILLRKQSSHFTQQDNHKKIALKKRVK